MYFDLRFSYKKVIAFLCFITVAVTFVVILRLNSVEEYDNIKPIITEAFSPEDYITSLGPKVDVDKCIIDEITVPFQFNDVYRSYNDIQKSQGFDLEKYKGKVLTRYTYPLIDYDSESDEVFAEILVYKNRIVGADIYSTDSYGFIKALK